MAPKYLPVAQLAETDMHLVDETDFENHPERHTLTYLLVLRKYLQHRATTAAIRTLRRSSAGLFESNEALKMACEHMEKLSADMGLMPGGMGAELASILATARMKIGPRK